MTEMLTSCFWETANCAPKSTSYLIHTLSAFDYVSLYIFTETGWLFVNGKLSLHDN